MLHRATVFGILFLSGSGFTHNLEGCWEGRGKIDLIYIGKRECSRIQIKNEISENVLVMKMLKLECPDFAPSWERKSFEVRNGNEVWGGVGGMNGNKKQIIGWLEKDSYDFDEPRSLVQFIEYKAVRSVISGQLDWHETFSQNQKVYWKLEGSLSSVVCDHL